MHYRKLFDGKETLGAWDLGGEDATVRITGVSSEKIGRGKNAEKKPVLTLAKTDKRLVLNITNAKIVAKLYGNDVSRWIDKRITLYGTTTEMAGETVECIRVRPVHPPDRATKKEPEPEAADAEPAPEWSGRQPPPERKPGDDDAAAE